MTKSEAITELVRIWNSPYLDLSLKAGLGEAIDALKGEDGDLISRQGALAKIRTRLQDWAAYGNEEYRRGLYACEDMIISLPSAEPKTGKWDDIGGKTNE